MTRSPPRLVAGALYPGCLALDLMGPMEVFNYASLEAEALGLRPYRLVTAGPEVGPVRTMSNIAVVADAAFGTLGAVDILLVPGARTGDFSYRESGLLDYLRRSADRIGRIASVCSGALILAEAGLLAGRRVTTHWMDCRDLESLCPDAKVEPDRIWIRDGAIYSSGGVTAGIDLALALVEEDLGRAIALKVARRMVLFLRRQGGQSQFSDLLKAQSRSERFSALIDWIEAHLAGDLTLAGLADVAGMSARTFGRRFTTEMGMTPAAYVAGRRVVRARQLIEETGLSLKEVAASAGFGDDERMRRGFQRAIGVTPSEYRDRFGAV